MAGRHTLLTRIMREYAGGGHSIFAPSASARWMSCAGSLIAGLFEEDKTIYEAAEGTVAHGIAEQWLRTDKEPNHLVGTTVTLTENGVSHEIPVTRSMLDYVREYVDWCRFENGDMFTEIKVWFTDLMPWANADELEENPAAKKIPFAPQGGTADNIIIQEPRIIVTDLKYGTGVQVFAEGNTQALLYAYGAYSGFCHEYELTEVEIRIAQPRLGHFDVWVITVDELLDFAEYARARAKEAWSLKAPRKASLKGCRFCRSAHNCAAIAFTMECALGGDIEFLESDFGDYEMSALRDALSEEYKFRRAQFGNLSTDDMAKILPWRKVIENWLARLDTELEKRALNGEKIPGQKLVESRTNRKFSEQDRVIELFKFLDIPEDKYMKTELRTPAQMEEVLREELGVSRAGAPELMADVVFKPEGKPTLVPLTDKRPPIDGKYSGAWDDEDEDDEEV